MSTLLLSSFSSLLRSLSLRFLRFLSREVERSRLSLSLRFELLLYFRFPPSLLGEREREGRRRRFEGRWESFAEPESEEEPDKDEAESLDKERPRLGRRLVSSRLRSYISVATMYMYLRRSESHHDCGKKGRTMLLS